ncbi:hypothetical protein ACA910_013024 [Epithemia clementina (nom. ined.)]
MPWKTLCGFPPNSATVSLLIPNGAWRPDTVITDTEGNEYFVLLEMDTSMRTYEAIFADLDGRPLVCVKRHILKAFWKDGYYFCTYRPNWRGQKPYGDRDIDGRKIYPHSYLECNPLKGRFFYRFIDQDRQYTRARLTADNPWLGFMMGCCTCCMRCGRFTAKFKKRDKSTQVFVDQWRNTVKVAPNNDLLAALCMAYVFDKCQNQPMVIMYGADEEDYAKADDDSIQSVSSEEDDEVDEEEARDVVNEDDLNNNRTKTVELENMSRFKDDLDEASLASKNSKNSRFSNAKQPHPYHPDATSVRSQQSHQTQRSQQTQRSHQTQRTHQTQQSQRSHQTQQSQRSHQTQQSQRSHQTQQSQRSHQTQQSQRSHQTQQTQQSQRSHQTQQSHRTQQSQQSLRSRQTQQSHRSHVTQQSQPAAGMMSSNASVASDARSNVAAQPAAGAPPPQQQAKNQDENIFGEFA